MHFPVRFCNIRKTNSGVIKKEEDNIICEHNLEVIKESLVDLPAGWGGGGGQDVAVNK